MIGWRSSRIGAGDHLVEATSSAASWIGGWEGGGDDDVRSVSSTLTHHLWPLFCVASLGW